MKRRLHPYRNTTSTNVPRRLMTPKLPARWRLRAWHRNPAPQSRTAKSAPPKSPQRRRLRAWHQNPAPQSRAAKSAPPKSPHRRRLRARHRNPAPQSRVAKSAPPKAHRYRGCMRGTEIRRHSHAWPSRPLPKAHRRRLHAWHRNPAPQSCIAKSAPPKPKEIEVARVAPKSGTTVTHGQVGPPTTSHNNTEPKSDQRCGGNTHGTKIRHHKHAWPNRPSEKPKNKTKSQK